jgi:hypothetical protein
MDGKKQSLVAKVGSFAWNIVTMIVCSYVLYLADVIGVMQRSKRVYSSFLNISYAAYAVFFVIWVYLAGIVSRKNPNWENTHMNFIYVATAAVSIGGFTWIVAMWPVFHVWTIPLGLVALFLFLSALSLLPTSKRKGE